MATTASVLRVAPASSSAARASSAKTSTMTRGGASGKSAFLRRSAPRGLFAPVVVAAASSEDDAASAKTAKTLDTGRLALLATVASHPVIFGCGEAMAKVGGCTT